MKTYEYICARSEAQDHQQPIPRMPGPLAIQLHKKKECTAFAARAFADKEMPGWDEIVICTAEGKELWAFFRRDSIGRELPATDFPKVQSSKVEEVPWDFYQIVHKLMAYDGMPQWRGLPIPAQTERPTHDPIPRGCWLAKQLGIEYEARRGRRGK